MSTIQRKGRSHLFNSLYTCKLKLPEDQRQQEKSVIAQPIFVFAKREQTFKRPAEDTAREAAEHGNDLHPVFQNQSSDKENKQAQVFWHVARTG